MGLLQLSLNGLQSQMLWGLIFPVLDPRAGEPDVALNTLTPVGETLQYNYSPVCWSPSWGMKFGYIANPCLRPISLWFLLYVFKCRRSYLVGSSHFHRWLSAGSCDFCVLVRGGELRVFVLRHLGRPPKSPGNLVKVKISIQYVWEVT